MVKLNSGYYFCHAFDLGGRLHAFQSFETRSSLTTVPNALRYQRLNHSSLCIWINELGLLVAFQPVPTADSLTKARLEYDDHFHPHYATVLREVALISGRVIAPDTSFIVVVGAEKPLVEWDQVQVLPDPAAAQILLEAIFIDELCRAIDRRSRTFVGESSLVQERLV